MWMLTKAALSTVLLHQHKNQETFGNVCYATVLDYMCNSCSMKGQPNLTALKNAIARVLYPREICTNLEFEKRILPGVPLL